MPEAKKKVGFKTFKNVFILGLVGIGGLWAYKHFASGGGKGGHQNANPGAPAPNMRGPVVQPGKTAIVPSGTCIQNKEDRFLYTPVEFTFDKFFSFIKSPVRGRYTGRMLCNGSMKMAEIVRA